MANPLDRFIKGEVKLERLKLDQRELRRELIEWAIVEGRADLFKLDIDRVFHHAGFANKRQAVMNMNTEDNKHL